MLFSLYKAFSFLELYMYVQWDLNKRYYIKTIKYFNIVKLASSKAFVLHSICALTEFKTIYFWTKYSLIYFGQKFEKIGTVFEWLSYEWQ